MTVVNLSVHKNNKWQRERKALRKDAVDNIKRLVNNRDVAGYVIVVWSEAGERRVNWEVTSKSKIRPFQMPDYCKHALGSELHENERGR
jgi:hypothetical protein|tara:strand:+ start:235 stop:501 length:267 start_codon:yes stop_codon:yes gene_type:complete